MMARIMVTMAQGSQMVSSRVEIGPWGSRHLRHLWRGIRVATGTAIAEAAVLWVAIEALSNESVGPVAFWPVIAAMLLIGVGPILIAGLNGWLDRIASPLLVVAAGVILIKGLAFPDIGWLDGAWLDGTGKSLILRESPDVLPVWVPILTVVAARWWRQRRADNTTDDVRISFRLGALLLVAAAVIGAFTGLESQGPVTTAATVFFAAILLATAWARQASVHPGELQGGTGVAAATSIAAVVAVLLAGTALVAITNPAAFDTLLWILSPLFWLIRNAILGLAFVFLIVLTPVFWFVSWLLSLRPVNTRPEVTPRVYDDPSPSTFAAPEDASRSLPDEIRIVLAVIALTILLIIIARQALRRVVAASGQTDVEQHIEFDPRSLLRRRRPAPAAIDADPLAGLREDPRFQNTIAVREIYAAFLRATGEAGLARRRPETARHHAQRIAAALGSPVEDIQTLNDAYGFVRYGAEPATDEQRRTVGEAWGRVSPRLHAIAPAAALTGHRQPRTGRA